MSKINELFNKYVPIARRQPKITKREALDIVPMRNSLVTWEKKGDEIVLKIPLPNNWFARSVKYLVRNLPDSRQLALDPEGSLVWELCDGEHSLEDLVKDIQKSTGLTRREAEASVTMFLQMLGKKNLIGLVSAGGRNIAKRK